MSLIEPPLRAKIALNQFEFPQHAVDQSILMNDAREERLVERLVTYTLEVGGQVVAVEHVPARVNEETGERFFAPETVERLQEIIRERREPSRMIQAPVFDFAA